MLKNQKGVSLLELVAALPLAVLVFTILTMAMANFITTYHEMRLFTQMQEELYSLVDTIRHGYMQENIENSDGLIGLLTANKASIASTGNSITVRPVIVTGGLPDAYRTTYTVDADGRMFVSGRYGLQSFSNTKIFPSSNKLIGRDFQFKIINSDIFSAEKTTTKGPILVNIHLAGRVRYREKGRDQSSEDDIRLNTKTIDFKTSVFVANTKS